MENKTYNPTKIYTFDYNEDVKDERWIQKSLALNNRAQWTCQRCGAIGNVVVHHPYYLDGLHLWDYPDTVLKVYCTKCHSIEHNSDIDPKDIVAKAIKKGVSKGEIIDCLEGLISEKSTPMPEGVIIAAEKKLKTIEIHEPIRCQNNNIQKENKDIIYIPYSLATCGFTASEVQLKPMIAILKQLKSQLRQMQCNYFLNTSQTQTLFSLYAESQTELELIIHPNELGVKTSQYQETLESLLGNNDSSIYIPVIEEGNKEKLHNTPIYKSLSRLGANEEISSNIALQTSIYKNCIKVVIERQIADYLFNDQKGIYSFSENAFKKLKGKYAKRLYLYLSVFRKNKRGFHEIDFWTFRNRIGFEDYLGEEVVSLKEFNPTLKFVYPLYSEFKKRVLEPSRKAIEELARNNEIDFTFTYEPIRHNYRSKNPKAIRFSFNFKNK